MLDLRETLRDKSSIHITNCSGNCLGVKSDGALSDILEFSAYCYDTSQAQELLTNINCGCNSRSHKAYESSDLVMHFCGLVIKDNELQTQRFD